MTFSQLKFSKSILHCYLIQKKTVSRIGFMDFTGHVDKKKLMEKKTDQMWEYKIYGPTTIDRIVQYLRVCRAHIEKY